MTEADWLAGTDPYVMFNQLRASGNKRKLRLAVCGLARQTWHLLRVCACKAVEVATTAADRGRTCAAVG